MQHLVAALVAVAVVDGAEMVEVEHQQHQFFAVFGVELIEPLLCPDLEKAPVEQAGELVLAHGFFIALLRLVLRGDVAANHQHVGWVAVGIEYRMLQHIEIYEAALPVGDGFRAAHRGHGRPSVFIGLLAGGQHRPHDWRA